MIEQTLKPEVRIQKDLRIPKGTKVITEPDPVNYWDWLRYRVGESPRWSGDSYLVQNLVLRNYYRSRSYTYFTIGQYYCRVYNRDLK